MKAGIRTWRPDPLLPGFEALELRFPDDYDGPVVATLVRLPVGEAPRGAVLYVHGFADYFFQRHMAERFAAEGYAFYALDLRKYGRSMREYQHPNFCKSISEYYADIDAAFAEIGAPALLAGHSTGGLITAMYAHEGERRSQIDALWLNSAFLDWNLPEWRKMQLHLAAAAGRYYPFLNDPKAFRPEDTRALLTEGGVDTKLKPEDGFSLYYGWLRARRDGVEEGDPGPAGPCPGR